MAAPARGRRGASCCALPPLAGPRGPGRCCSGGRIGAVLAKPGGSAASSSVGSDARRGAAARLETDEVARLSEEEEDASRPPPSRGGKRGPDTPGEPDGVSDDRAPPLERTKPARETAVPPPGAPRRIPPPPTPPRLKDGCPPALTVGSEALPRPAVPGRPDGTPSQSPAAAALPPSGCIGDGVSAADSLPPALPASLRPAGEWKVGENRGPEPTGRSAPGRWRTGVVDGEAACIGLAKPREPPAAAPRPSGCLPTDSRRDSLRMSASEPPPRRAEFRALDGRDEPTEAASVSEARLPISIAGTGRLGASPWRVGVCSPRRGAGSATSDADPLRLSTLRSGEDPSSCGLRRVPHAPPRGSIVTRSATTAKAWTCERRPRSVSG